MRQCELINFLIIQNATNTYHSFGPVNEIDITYWFGTKNTQKQQQQQQQRES